MTVFGVCDREDSIQFTLKSTMNLLYESGGYVKVWVDGSCLNNGRRNPAAGYGVVFNIHHVQ